LIPLQQLQERVIACRLCPRLVEHRETVAVNKRRMYLDWDYWGKPLPSFGDPAARVLIMGLAPAAHGGNRTGRMFTGDRSGDWVFGTLHKFGFASSPDAQRRDDGMVLRDAYITASLRCAPPANKPLKEELANCQPYLIRELELLVNVRVIIALGKIAFDTYLAARRQQDPAFYLTVAPSVRLGGGIAAGATGRRAPRPRFGHNVEYPIDDDTTLIGSYHPSQQNTQTGRLTHEMFDAVFQHARDILSRHDNHAAAPHPAFYCSGLLRC
jgi:uracil-DNA glycosylase family 4